MEDELFAMKGPRMLLMYVDQDPVCTPDGYLYSREAILESLLQQKKSNKRKYAVWEAQQQAELRKVSS